MAFYDSVKILTTTLSWTSVLLSTFVLYRNRSKKRRRFPVRLISYFAACSVIYHLNIAVGSLIGYKHLERLGSSATGYCIFQGCVFQFFSCALCGWYMITYYCFSTVLYNIMMPTWQLQKKETLFHIMVWGISLILTILPVVSGNIEEVPHLYWCWISANSAEREKTYMLQFYLFYIEMAICLVVAILFLFRMIIGIRNLYRQQKNYQRIVAGTGTLKLSTAKDNSFIFREEVSSFGPKIWSPYVSNASEYGSRDTFKAPSRQTSAMSKQSCHRYIRQSRRTTDKISGYCGEEDLPFAVSDNLIYDYIGRYTAFILMICIYYAIMVVYSINESLFDPDINLVPHWFIYLYVISVNGLGIPLFLIFGVPPRTYVNKCSPCRLCNCVDSCFSVLSKKMSIDERSGYSAGSYDQPRREIDVVNAEQEKVQEKVTVSIRSSIRQPTPRNQQFNKNQPNFQRKKKVTISEPITNMQEPITGNNSQPPKIGHI